MTIQRVIEEIKQTFPQIQETQIIHDLDLAQKDFVSETRFLEDYAGLDNVNDFAAWVLPDDFNGLKDVLIFDTNGNPLYLNTYDIDYELEFGNIYFRSTSSTPLTKLPDAIAYVYIHYYKKAPDLTLRSDSFSVDDEFVEGIIAKIFKKYHTRIPVDTVTRDGIVKIRDMNMVRYYTNIEIEYRIKAKRWVNRKNNDPNASVVNYGMAGKFHLTKRSMDMATLTPVITAYLKSHGVPTKYAQYLVTSTTITQVGTAQGYSSLSVGLDANNKQVTITGDISVKTIVTSSNGDMWVVSNDGSSTIVVEFPDLDNTYVLEIYDK